MSAASSTGSAEGDTHLGDHVGHGRAGNHLGLSRYVLADMRHAFFSIRVVWHAVELVLFCGAGCALRGSHTQHVSTR